MSSIIENKDARISIFFRLHFDEKLLQEILDEIEDFEIIGKKGQTRIGDVALGPVLVELGTLLMDEYEYTFNYIVDRYLLQIQGDIRSLDKVAERVMDAFDKEYKFESNTRFTEVSITNWLISDTDLADSIKKHVQINNIEQLQQKYETNLVPYSIELASSWSPIDKNWFSIKLKYDVMSPAGKIWLSIVKRFEDGLIRLVGFLENLKTIEEDIKNWLTST